MFTTFEIQRPHTTSLSVDHGAETTADNEEEICVKIEQYSVNCALWVHTEWDCALLSHLQDGCNRQSNSYPDVIKQQGKWKGQSLRTIIKDKDLQTLFIVWKMWTVSILTQHSIAAISVMIHDEITKQGPRIDDDLSTCVTPAQYIIANIVMAILGADQVTQTRCDDVSIHDDSGEITHVAPHSNLSQNDGCIHTVKTP